MTATGQKPTERDAYTVKTFLLLAAVLLFVVQAAMADSPSSRSKKTGTRIIRNTEGPKGTSQEFNFSGGWKWTYRKEVMVRLREDIIKSDDLETRVVKTSLGLSSSDRKHMIEEAGLLTKSLNAGGNIKKAEEYRKIITFYKDGKNESELEDISRANPGSDISCAAQFLLGDFYEKKGFYPEASGYFHKISRESKGGFILAAALYKKARLLFFENKFNDARSWFERAVQAGSVDARPWLANTLLIKGETGQAWKIYKDNPRERNPVDPITLMSIGDISVIKQDFNAARNIFDTLANDYRKKELVAVFFALKTGDAYLAEGRRDEAIKIYRKTKAALTGEGWGMAALSLADALAANTDGKSLAEAMSIYQNVSSGDYIGSEFANMSLISTEIRLEKFDEAAANFKAFPDRFPTSPLRANMSSLEGQLAYRWISSLFVKGDYYGAVKLYSRYGAKIPFGKKAETYFKTGSAFAKLGLSPEAVNNLDRAIKMGSDAVAEKAMITLARVYLSQGDASAGERMTEIFRTRFPKSVHKGAVEKILFDIAYMKKDYKKAADSRTVLDDPKDLMLKAYSLLTLRRNKEAASLFEKAAVKFGEEGDTNGAASAYMAIADADFASGDYGKAISNYRKAADIKGNLGGDKSWALYRIAQSYSRLHKDAERNEALKELDGQHDEYGHWSEEIFKEPRQNL